MAMAREDGMSLAWQSWALSMPMCSALCKDPRAKGSPMKHLNERQLREGVARRPRVVKVLASALILHLASRRAHGLERVGRASRADESLAAAASVPAPDPRHRRAPRLPGALVLVTGVALLAMVALAVRKRPMLARLVRQTLTLSALRMMADHHRVGRLG